MTRRFSAVLPLAAMLIAGPVAAASVATMPPPDAVTQGSSEAYRIGPRDKLDINVSQAKELTGAFQVDAEGKVLLPLVGQLKAAGRTPAEFSEDLKTALMGSYMKNPVVTVAVNEAESQRVTIDGAVVQPGVYPLTGPTTLIQAVALAKGPDPRYANIRKVSIFRQIEGERRSVVYDLARVRAGQAADPAVYGTDIVVVDTSSGKAFMQNFQGGFGLVGMLIRPW
jgi:polysaccharide export outer membrane protein